MMQGLTELSLYRRDSQNLNSLRTENQDKEKLLQVCRDFEAIFIKQMLDSMRNTVDKSELVGTGMAEDIFEDLLYDQYAKKISQTANLGISQLLYKQLSNQG